MSDTDFVPCEQTEILRIIQTVSRQLLTAEAWVRSKVKICKIRGGQKVELGQVFPCQ
jgi:hypothetical protein